MRGITRLECAEVYPNQVNNQHKKGGLLQPPFHVY